MCHVLWCLIYLLPVLVFERVGVLLLFIWLCIVNMCHSMSFYNVLLLCYQIKSITRILPVFISKSVNSFFMREISLSGRFLVKKISSSNSLYDVTQLSYMLQDILFSFMLQDILFSFMLQDILFSLCCRIYYSVICYRIYYSVVFSSFMYVTGYIILVFTVQPNTPSKLVLFVPKTTCSALVCLISLHYS